MRVRPFLALLPALGMACGPASGPIGVPGDDPTPTGDGTMSDGSCAPRCDPSFEVCVQGTCVPCAPMVTVPGAVRASVPIGVTLDEVGGPFEERRILMRPLLVQGAGTLEMRGDTIEVFDAAGARLGDGDTVAETPLLVHGIATGEADLEVRPLPSCPSDTPAIASLRVGPTPELAGRALAGYPHFEPVRSLNITEVLQTAIDPFAHPDRVGATFDVFVVPHRTPAEWAADPSLSDVGDGASGIVVEGSVRDNVIDVWRTIDAGPALVTPFDVVYDFDRNGTLDPGDLIDGFDTPGVHAVQDLSLPGPHATATLSYSADFWNTMVVYAPDPPVGDHPLVVISHGNGHEYTWYDYLGNHLASWGYVVIAHRNDTVPGPVTAAITTFTNTDAFLSALPTLGGGLLDGRVDASRISWIGHSRGGEGVVIAYDKVRDGVAVPRNYTASDIVLVSSIAPTLFEGPDVANPNEVAYHLLAGSRDGDVTGGVDCDLCQYFRIFQRGDGPRLATYVQGATHNDFNCCGFNDGVWAGGQGQVIGRNRAQQLAKSYYLALLEFVVRGNAAMEDYLGRLPEGFRPVAAQAVVATQYKRAPPHRAVIDDFQTNPDPTQGSAGGQVSWTVENLVEGPLDDGNTSLQWVAGDPMNGMTQSDGDPAPARGIVFDFPDGSDLWLEFGVPVGLRDASPFAYLSFRACQGTRHPYTEALDDMMSFSATLVDGAGTESTIDFGVYGRLTEPYERTDGTPGSGWVNEFQTVRIPLRAFTTDGSGLDLTNVTAIRFGFGVAQGSPQGRIGFDDLEFTE